MDRLTINTPQGPALKMGDTYPSEEAAREDLMRLYYIAVARLAAYEDTKLEPGEIMELKRAWKAACKSCGINATVGEAEAALKKGEEGAK